MGIGGAAGAPSGTHLNAGMGMGIAVNTSVSVDRGHGREHGHGPSHGGPRVYDLRARVLANYPMSTKGGATEALSGTRLISGMVMAWQAHLPDLHAFPLASPAEQREVACGYQGLSLFRVLSLLGQILP